MTGKKMSPHFHFLVLITLFFTTMNHSADAVVLDDLNVLAELTVSIETHGLLQQPLRTKGDITWHLPKGQQELCFSLPFNSPDFGWNSNLTKHHELLGQRPPKPIFLGGSTTANLIGDQFDVEKLSPYLWRVRPRKATEDISTVAFRFESKTPWLPNSENTDWFFQEFYPTLLKECPSVDASLRYYRKHAQTQFQVNIAFPAGWELASPGVVNSQPETLQSNRASFSQESFDLGFALVKNYKTAVFEAGGVKVHLLFRSSLIEALSSTIKETLDFYVELLGPFPHKDLWILESSELQRQDFTGMIAINTPRQAAFSLLQSKLLNWSHWNIVSLIAQQWMGVAIRPETVDYTWILNGLSEFLSLEALRQNNKRYNLINIFDIGYAGVSLNYLEVQNLTASIFHKTDERYTLVDDEFRATHSFRRQNPLDYIKLAVALRHLKSRFGSSSFFRILKSFVKKNSGLSVDAKEFFEGLTDISSPLPPSERVEFAHILSQWLQKPGWPDVSIESANTELLSSGLWVTKIQAKHKDSFDFNIPISVVDDENSESIVFAQGLPNQQDNLDGLFEAEIVTRGKPIHIELDKTQSFFDGNRFNNSFTWPSWKFFPGNASTFSDKDYTVLWVPYPIRRSGQGFSLGIQGGIFKYLNGQMTARVERELKTGHNAWTLNSKFDLWRRKVTGDIQLQQNLKDFRVAEIGFEGKPNIDWHQKPSLRIGTRFRDIQHRSNSERLSSFVGLTLSPRDRYESCSYLSRAEMEYSPDKSQHQTGFLRSLGLLNLNCQAADLFDLQWRFFAGGVNHVDKNTPEFAYFDPQEGKEARLRIDMKAGSHQKIATTSFDLLFPIRLGIPDSFMVLSRRIKMRAFFDYGKSLEKQPTHYKASGTGLFVPFGGDLSGVGSLALTQLSILAVLYSEAGDQTSYKPRILLDLSGQL